MWSAAQDRCRSDGHILRWLDLLRIVRNCLLKSPSTPCLGAGHWLVACRPRPLLSSSLYRILTTYKQIPKERWPVLSPKNLMIKSESQQHKIMLRGGKAFHNFVTSTSFRTGNISRQMQRQIPQISKDRSQRRMNGEALHRLSAVKIGEDPSKEGPSLMLTYNVKAG